MQKNLSDLENIIGYQFKDQALLLRAVTHSSYASDKTGNPSNGNERLEFLGDAVLGMRIGLKLYNRLSDVEEGKLSKTRASIVCERSLADAGIKSGINEFIYLSHGMDISGGRLNKAIIADCVEAIIGAAYLDGGEEASARVIDVLLCETIEQGIKGTLPKDSKSTLQEYYASMPAANLSYRITDQEGPDHNKLFTAVVSAFGKDIGTGKGKSKKLAEAAAAAAALEDILKPGGK